MLSFKRLNSNLERADLTEEELLALQQLIEKKRLSKKTCTAKEERSIDAFIESIGYEITSAQPTASQLEVLQAVPQRIKARLLELVPYAHNRLIVCLTKLVIPHSNLYPAECYVDALKELFSKLALGKEQTLQEDFFKHILSFTTKAGIDFATLALTMLAHNKFSLEQIQSFLNALLPIQKSLLKKIPQYETPTYHEADITELLAMTNPVFLPYLETVPETDDEESEKKDQAKRTTPPCSQDEESPTEKNEKRPRCSQ